MPPTGFFFSSQNAVRFFFRRLQSGGSMESRGDSKSPRDLPQVKWAALGGATAKALAEYVDKVDFTGTGEPEGTAVAFRRVNPTPGPSPTGRGDVDNTVENTTEEIAEHSTSPLPSGEGPGVGSRILFPAARHSRQSVMSLLSPDFQCIHFPVYDNRPVANPLHSAADVLVFTSPLNAQAYFSKNKLGKNQRVVAIGQTTGATLRELGIAEIQVAREPGERALAEMVLKIEV
ncbi:MAG TPA: uroporphyrinogen-III synthase [Saprospiraceae bacterium]|nr:uroporphyrinogen-III synthase [Saprospiraceae bacterium]